MHQNKPTLAATIRPLTENDSALIYTFFTSFSAQTRQFFTPHAIDLPGLTRIIHNIPTDPTVARVLRHAHRGRAGSHGRVRVLLGLADPGAVVRNWCHRPFSRQGIG